MRELILDSLRTAVKYHPEVINHLEGDALLYAKIFAYKEGEAPDDDVRVADEKTLADDLEVFLAGQLKRILRYLREQYRKDFQMSFWGNETHRMWDTLGDDFVGILIHGAAGGVNILDPSVSDLINDQLIQSNLIQYASQYRDKWLFQINETSRAFIEKSVQDWLVTGQPIDSLIKVLSNPELGMFTRQRAEMIAVTEVTRLHAMANKLAWESTGAIKDFRWMTAMDERVCIVCGENQGKLYPIKQMETLLPAHPRCLIGDTNVLAQGVSAGSKRWFEGNVVTIETFKNKLTVTPNHPILTLRGWVSAGKLIEGDYILGYTSSDWKSALVNVNNKNGVTSVENIFSSLDVNGFRVPVAPPDFHNDGAGSNVAVIRSNCKIVNNINTKLLQPVSQLDFTFGHVVSHIPFAHFSPEAKLIERNIASPGSLVSSGDLLFSLFSRHTFPFEDLGLRLPSWIYAILKQSVAKRPPVDTSLFSETVFGLSGNVTLQQVVKITNNNFSGHVYNLQTNSEMYVANGIITHNCRCWGTPIVDRDLARQQLDDLLGTFGI